MAQSLGVRVVHYDSRHVANPYPKGELPWQVYHTVRNAIFRACRSMGRREQWLNAQFDTIRTWTARYGMEDWPIGDEPCEYFIVDDQYGHEQYLYMENLRHRATLALLAG